MRASHVSHTKYPKDAAAEAVDRVWFVLQLQARQASHYF